MHAVPKLKEMLEQLVATTSISSTQPEFDHSNQGVIDLLANWLEPAEFGVAIQPIADRPGKANLIATRGRGEGGLVLSGHTDTVPVNPELWQSDPFRLSERNNRWYGLGACDMKSFFALVLEALAPYAGVPFRHPLVVLATADEESSMSGARALNSAQLMGSRFALIGEPTSLRPVTRHKGIMMLSLRITGSSGHSSNPALGNSALDATAGVLSALDDFRQLLRKQHQDLRFDVSYPTLNFGCIHGGDNPNRICDHVDLAFDLRTLPGMDNGAIKQQIEELLRPGLQARGLRMDLTLMHPWVDAFDNSDPDFVNVMHGLTGAEPISVAFATEAPFLSALGMETVVMGAGSIDQAHQPNEFLPQDEIPRAVAIIRALIEKYCIN
ncbi:MAG: acetylornithine deacetylase [Pseudomonadota bacterium]